MLFMLWATQTNRVDILDICDVLCLVTLPLGTGGGSFSKECERLRAEIESYKGLEKAVLAIQNHVAPKALAKEPKGKDD